MPSDEELAFLERIRALPDDDGPRLIYADWLDDRADARGPLIRVQCALAHLPGDDPRRADLMQEEASQLQTLEPAWKVALHGLAADWTCSRGLIEAISVDAEAFVERGEDIFRLGPIRRVRFLEASRCFPRLMACPTLARVPEIDLCGNFLGNAAIAHLASARHLHQLRSLHLGFNDLTDQGLRALAEIPHLSQLRELYLDDNKHLAATGLRPLADSPYMANLRLLDLSGNNLTEPALKVLLNGEAITRLESLRLAGNDIGDGGVAALARSALLPRMLRFCPSLDLCRNNIGPVGARALADSPSVEMLEELDLGSNAIGNTGLTSLAQSAYLGKLKRLAVSENRISDAGVMAVARSALPASLEFLDLTGNFVTAESIDALDSTAIGYDWRKHLEIQTDPGLMRSRRRR